MSWFLSVVYDGWMKRMERVRLQGWRAELLAPLAGAVLEVGAGTGANLPHYGAAVTRLVLAEPDRHMRAKLDARLTGEAARARTELSDAKTAPMPFRDGEFDAVVCTLVLCSVADPAASLAEIRRVLKPGGKLVFMEHVAAAAPGRFGWQRRLEPIWKRLAGNCHLTRRTAETIAGAGFTFETLVAEEVPESMPITRASVRGVAVRA